MYLNGSKISPYLHWGILLMGYRRLHEHYCSACGHGMYPHFLFTTEKDVIMLTIGLHCYRRTPNPRLRASLRLFIFNSPLDLGHSIFESRLSTILQSLGRNFGAAFQSTNQTLLYHKRKLIRFDDQIGLSS